MPKLNFEAEDLIPPMIPVSDEKIIKCLCEYYKITRDELFKKNNPKTLIPRQLFVYMLRKWGREERTEKIISTHKYQWLFNLVEPKCAFCGFDDVIEVHHILSPKKGGGNTQDNLLILCPNHHALLHAGLIKVKEGDYVR